MTYLDQLINKYCPDGYEWVKLEDVVDYIQPAKYIEKIKDFEDDGIPVLTPGKQFILGYTKNNNNIFYASNEKPVILFDDFTTSFKLVNFPFKVRSSACKILIPKIQDVSIMFVYYFMQTITYEIDQHSRQWISNYSKLLIPKIPLKMQEKIVEILERFSILKAELKAELEARGKQFEFWKNNLFNFKDFKIKTISEMCEITRGKVISKQFIANNKGMYPVYSSQTVNNGILGNINTYDFDGNYLTWTTDGANAGTIFYRSGKFNVTNVCGLLKIKNDKETNIKFLYYALSLVSKDYVNYDNSNPKLMSNVMADIKIKIPPIETQNKIVSMFDKLSEYSQEINSGLPAEIGLRSKQFKYYRDLLLDFKKDE
ncbi:restriction endonuclease subunit S [Mycoplasmopsis adleri]|uniref:restriction endonuclease subunit S n=1 Tax=Mycoplasmopsis adleri TaxID=51362 RepID=UPI0038732D1B